MVKLCDDDLLPFSSMFYLSVGNTFIFFSSKNLFLYRERVVNWIRYYIRVITAVLTEVKGVPGSSFRRGMDKYVVTLSSVTYNKAGIIFLARKRPLPTVTVLVFQYKSSVTIPSGSNGNRFAYRLCFPIQTKQLYTIASSRA